MAAKKKPVSPTPPAKKQASASSFRKKEEEGKAKAKLQARVDSKGRGGMGASKPKSTYESRTGIRTNKTLNTAQNIARSAVLGGGAVKAVSRAVAVNTTKKLQRELSQYQKEKSMKGLTRQQRIVEGERRSELTPEEYAENFKRDRDLRKKVSDSMKKTAPKKKK